MKEQQSEGQRLEERTSDVLFSSPMSRAAMLEPFHSTPFHPALASKRFSRAAAAKQQSDRLRKKNSTSTIRRGLERQRTTDGISLMYGLAPIVHGCRRDNVGPTSLTKRREETSG